MAPDVLETCHQTLTPFLPVQGMVVAQHFEDTDEDPSWMDASAVAQDMSVSRVHAPARFLGKDWAEIDPTLRQEWRVFTTQAWSLWLNTTYQGPLEYTFLVQDQAPFSLIAHERQPTLPTTVLYPDRERLPELLRLLPQDWRYQATPASRHEELDHLRVQMSLPAMLQPVYHRLITLHDALDFLQMIHLGPHRLLMGRRRDFAATLIACA